MWLTWRYVECVNSILGDMNLWNDLGFSLCAMLSVCDMIATLDEWMKSKIEVSANWYVAIDH